MLYFIIYVFWKTSLSLETSFFRTKVKLCSKTFEKYTVLS